MLTIVSSSWNSRVHTMKISIVTLKVGEKRTCRIEHERVIVRELVLDRGESLPQLPWADDVLVQLSVGQ